MTKPRIETFPDRAALMQAAADRIADALRGGIEERGAARAALSGGGSPAPAYERLAAAPLDWPNVTFALVDERFVPATSEQSNEGMLRARLGPALFEGARLLPLFAMALSQEEAADIADAVYAPLSFDIALMGMGEDGHTASWFPGAPQLAAALDPENLRSVIGVDAPASAQTRARLTLTYAALKRAKRIVLLIAGAEKRARFEAALRQSPLDAPVAALFDGGVAAPEVLWAP